MYFYKRQNYALPTAAQFAITKSSMSRTSGIAIVPSRLYEDRRDAQYWQPGQDESEEIICDLLFLPAVKAAFSKIDVLCPMVFNLMANQPVMVRRSQISPGWYAPMTSMISFIRNTMTSVWKKVVNEGSVDKGNKNIENKFKLFP